MKRINSLLTKLILAIKKKKYFTKTVRESKEEKKRKEKRKKQESVYIRFHVDTGSFGANSKYPEPVRLSSRDTFPAKAPLLG